MSAPYWSLAPGSDAARIDWATLDAAFEWLRALHRCPQDPVFHAEGNVGIHTRMVAEALLADAVWRALPSAEQRMLFWAALLHDVAKPATTRIGDDGRVASPGHSRRGQIMARQILWELGAPFAERETVCHLVSHHQLPLYLMERARPERRLHLASHQTRADLLVVLAAADVRGRICADAGRLLDNIALFAELAHEEGCLAAPRPFASDHSRFLYFRKPDRAPDYAAYDDWPGRLTLLSGLPGAGKSTWARSNAAGATIINLDDIRDELGIGPEGEQGPVLAAARDRARLALRRYEPLVWDATSLARDRRAGLIDLAAAYRARVTIVYCEAPPGEVHRRNLARPRPVPAHAIARMLERWEVPDKTECHDLVTVISEQAPGSLALR